MYIDKVSKNIGLNKDEFLDLCKDAFQVKSFCETFTYDEFLQNASIVKIIYHFIFTFHYRIIVLYRLIQLITKKIIEHEASYGHRNIHRYYMAITTILDTYLKSKYDVSISPYCIIPRGFIKGARYDIGITAGSRIGNNVSLGRGVRIATSPGRRTATIDDDVNIWTNAVISGHVHIGRGATVAANSLVIKDVPEGVTVMGVPAIPVFKRTIKKEHP